MQVKFSYYLVLFCKREDRKFPLELIVANRLYLVA